MMETTIAVSGEVRDDIKEFGNKGETYNDILKKLLRSARERQLQELLIDTSDSVPVNEALSRAMKRWQ